jgi:hypothetical protein
VIPYRTSKKNLEIGDLKKARPPSLPRSNVSESADSTQSSSLCLEYFRLGNIKYFEQLKMLWWPKSENCGGRNPRTSHTLICQPSKLISAK